MSNEFILVDVYTDGSTNTFPDVPFGLAGCGIFVPKVENKIDEIKLTHKVSGIGINTTELLAIKIGLTTLTKVLTDEEIVLTTVRLYSDSKNCLNGLNKYYKNWKKNAINGKWIKTNGEEVENQDMYEEILRIKSYFLKVEFIHVFSHTGIHGNDIADGLAKNAVNELYNDIKLRNSKAKTFK